MTRPRQIHPATGSPSPRPLAVSVRVTPNAPATGLVGLRGDTVKIKLRAPALEGRANVALVEFLADLLGCHRNRIQIARGETSRDKLIVIDLPQAEQPAARRLLGLPTDPHP